MQGSYGYSLPAGRVFGIPISIHWSLLALSVAYVVRALAISTPLFALLALIITVLATFSILAHELAHAFAASRFGSRTRSIELHAFGGVAQIVGGATGSLQAARNDILIALAGPLANFALYGLLSAAASLAAPSGITHLVLVQTAQLNLILGAFNLVPCFPMDGGRALLGALRLKMGPVHGDRLAYTVGLTIAVPAMIYAILISHPVMMLVFYMAFDTCRQHRAALDASFGQGGARVVHAFPGEGPGLFDRIRTWFTPTSGGILGEPRPPKLRVIKGGRFEEPPDRTASR